MSDPSTAARRSRLSSQAIVLSLIALAAIAYLIFTLVASGAFGGPGSAPMTPEAIADRLKPVATVNLGAAVSQGPQTGEAVFKSVCSACHATGAAGSPKAGDAAAWGPRIAQGYDTLVKHATEGYKGMPARGGNPSLQPLEVARAVAYLANLAGAKFKEPEAAAAGGAAAK